MTSKPPVPAREPQTEAGRALLTELLENPLPGARYSYHVVSLRIAAIEAEARAGIDPHAGHAHGPLFTDHHATDPHTHEVGEYGRLRFGYCAVEAEARAAAAAYCHNTDPQPCLCVATAAPPSAGIDVDMPKGRATIDGHLFVHVAACPCPEMQAEVARLAEPVEGADR